MPAIFSSDGRSFGFLKTEASVRMGLKSVVSTLMRRTNTIPSSEALRTEETSHVKNSLHGYPTKFIENAAQPRSGPRNHHLDPAGLALVPYVQGISDRVKRILQQFNIKTALKTAEIRFENLGNLFKFRAVLNPFLAIFIKL